MPLRTLLLWVVCLTGLLPPEAIPAQTAPDADPGALPATPVHRPNGTRVLPDGTQRPALFVRDERFWTPGHRHQIGSPGAPCDLVVEEGGRLRLRDSQIVVHGDVVLGADGRLDLEQCDLWLGNVESREFNVWWEGGHLDTRGVRIGGNPLTRKISGFYLDHGLWTAQDTTVSLSGGILVGTNNGRYRRDRRRGGILRADGLYAGDAGDYVHLSGWGDVTLRNSAFGVSIRLYDTGPTNGVSPLDLRSSQRFGSPEVYGDPQVHDGTHRPGVDHPIPGARWRLELEETTVTIWRVAFHGIGPNGSARTYRLDNAEAISVGLHGEGLSGSPRRIGNWSAYYPAPLPDLPTADAPGHHGIPPGCGLQIGNLTLLSPPDRFSYIVSWGLYLDEPTTFTVRGPTNVGEIYLWDTTLILEGIEGYQAGLRCLTAQLSGTAHLTIRNGVVGAQAGLEGDLLATGRSSVLLDSVRTRRVRLRTAAQTRFGPNNGINAGNITVRDPWPSVEAGETMTTQRTGQGVIDVGPPVFANADLESGSGPGGAPQNWAVGGSGNASIDTSRARPGSPTGSRSARYTATGGTGSLALAADLPPGTRIEAYAWLRASQLPSAGALEAGIWTANGPADLRAVTIAANGTWQLMRLGELVVGANDGAVAIGIRHSGTSGRIDVHIDDVVVKMPSFEDSTNLLNLDFELPRVRQLDSTPFNRAAPDYWGLLNGTTELITSSGAQGRAARIHVDGGKATLRKDLDFLAPGTRIRVSGRVRATDVGGGAIPVDLHIGEGNRYWQALPGHQYQRIQDATSWTPFQLTYQKTSGSTDATAVVIACGDTGVTLDVDDVQIEILEAP